MSKPENFILTSDFATLKNDGEETTFVVMPSAISVTGNGSYSVSADIVMGTNGSITRSLIGSSKDSDKWYATNSISYLRTGIASGSPAIYEIYAFVWRPNATTIRCQLHIQNPYSVTLTGATGAETISFVVNTYLPPYV